MGFSFKMGYFAPDDYTALKNLTKTEKTLLDQNIYNSWDGKTLTIDTENLNLKSIEEAIKTKSSKEEAEKNSRYDGHLSQKDRYYIKI